MNSKLWFVNNPELILHILAYLAKYQQEYEVILYGFVLMGNHYHMIAKFPRGNRAAFMRDFNSIVARLVGYEVVAFEGGKLWGRRYSCQILPLQSDVEHWFFYAALNPVSSGLVQKLSEYPTYNSVIDAIKGIEQTYQCVDWTDYHNRKRYNAILTILECTKTYTLKFSRLPGYETLSEDEYQKLILEKLEKKQREIVQMRLKDGNGFAGKQVLDAIPPGDSPVQTKSGGKRPLVLTLCVEAKKRFFEWYFDIYKKFREASKKYLSGDVFVDFPERTYKPPLFLVPQGMPG